MRIKSSGLARGLANARPSGSATFANAPPPGLTRRANAPQLPGGGGLGAGGIDWCISGERAENAKFQNDQTHKNREVERGRSVELVSSTPCPPI